MNITTYVELTEAQKAVLDEMQEVEVRTALIQPAVVATFRTFQLQKLQLTIDKDGVILHAAVLRN